MKKSPKIIFFGTEEYSLVALKALVENDFDVVAVVTKPDMIKGRGRKLVAPPVKAYAIEQNIAVWQPTKLTEIADKITALQPVAGVLVAYGKIIPQRIINLFTPGIINLHPSLLPLYRGPSPIESAIANLDNETGVSIMKLDAEMDAGPVYYQVRLALSGSETKQELYDQLFALGSQTLIETLPDIISGELQPIAQDHTKATYCQMLSKDLSLIDPIKLTATQAEAHVRAYLGFPRSQVDTTFDRLTITKAHVSQTADSALSIKCRDDIFLTIDELISPSSGRTISAGDFFNGIKNRF
ncbi:methionyl-tRNA formyltransferase [Candidatus Saccharibacteria bacterium]|nr:methionyl-tRNA formyltransferase [Candidatus Saccharibacteria bacterium]